MSTRKNSLGAPAAAAAKRLGPRHRNLFNGDSCVFFYNPEEWQSGDFAVREVDGQPQPVGGPFKAQAIHRFVENLAVSGLELAIRSGAGPA
jgi:hypothetical protein